MYRNTIQNMSETELDELREQNDISQTADVDDILDILDPFECIEDDILNTFLNGNYLDGANQMLEHNITPYDLIDWLEEQREELGIWYYADIGLLTVISITESYYQAIRGV